MDQFDRTNDPLRLYLQEVGSGALLSRDGEIAIAKRMEAGRKLMLQGIGESPLTARAVATWRRELLEQAIRLSDVIDVDATVAAAFEVDVSRNWPAPERFDPASCSRHPGSGVPGAAKSDAPPAAAEDCDDEGVEDDSLAAMERL